MTSCRSDHRSCPTSPHLLRSTISCVSAPSGIIGCPATLPLWGCLDSLSMSMLGEVLDSEIIKPANAALLVNTRSRTSSAPCALHRPGCPVSSASSRIPSRPGHSGTRSPSLGPTRLVLAQYLRLSPRPVRALPRPLVGGPDLRTSDERPDVAAAPATSRRCGLLRVQPSAAGDGFCTSPRPGPELTPALCSEGRSGSRPRWPRQKPPTARHPNKARF